MDLLAGDNGHIADVTVALNCLQRRVVALVIRNDHEIVAMTAVVGYHVDGIVMAIGIAGMKVQIAPLGNTAGHILSQAVDRQGGEAAVSVKQIDVVLTLPLKAGGDAKAPIGVGGQGKGGAATPLG